MNHFTCLRQVSEPLDEALARHYQRVEVAREKTLSAYDEMDLDSGEEFDSGEKQMICQGDLALLEIQAPLGRLDQKASFKWLSPR